MSISGSSRRNEAVNDGIFLELVGRTHSIRLRDHYSVFHTEVLAIGTVEQIIKNNKISKSDISILCDTQAGVKHCPVFGYHEPLTYVVTRDTG